jgi:hypothetical protein
VVLAFCLFLLFSPLSTLNSLLRSRDGTRWNSGTEAACDKETSKVPVSKCRDSAKLSLCIEGDSGLLEDKSSALSSDDDMVATAQDTEAAHEKETHLN